MPGAPPPPLATLVSQRRKEQANRTSRAYVRLFLIGCIAWPVFAVHDVIFALWSSNVRSLAWVEGVRLFGECIALPCFFLVRSGRLTPRQTLFVDYLVFGLGGALLGLMAIPIGGITSRHSQGVMIFIFARCTVFPLPWKRALPVPLACAFAYPIALALASLVMPSLAAQWSDRAALGLLVDNETFVFSALAVAVFASHVIDHAQQQVHAARQLGSYRLSARIGSGGGGDVWLARQVSLDRDVALKVLRLQASRSEEAIRRFTFEAKAASQLTHPNTIRIYDFGASDDGVVYLAMELLEGLDAAALVHAAGPLPPARVIYLARQVCGSLAEAHARGLVHRDIKPANLFIARAGEEYDVVKVLDFGVARRMEHAGRKRDSRSDDEGIVGTPDFMAPEVCCGDPADVRSDVYSLGASLHFMLTGQRLFPDRTFTEVISMQIAAAPERPSDRVRGVPADLDAVILRCLEKNPADRFPNVRELDRALASCEDAEGWSAEKARRWWQLRREEGQRQAG